MKRTDAVSVFLRHTLFVPLVLTAVVASGAIQANGHAEAEAVEQVLKQKPFAESRVALQISDADLSKQTLILNVASNLLKHYGQDEVDVEIIAFGPGLDLLLQDNEQANRITALADQGVRFSACQNSATNMSKKLGQALELNPDARLVPAGIVRLVQLDVAGYSIAKP
ncbi:MAG TPA: hypothetical protein VK979_00365 [Guyparkeria sp.]|nr:hypothetical protein [Guyparkeria sp.]